jgi:hypothetical protein
MADFLEDEAEKTYRVIMSVAKCTAEQLARTTLTDLDLAGVVLQGIERELGVGVWATISPWEFVAAMPTVFAKCRQSGNASAWFEEVTGRSACGLRQVRCPRMRSSRCFSTRRMPGVRR